MNEAGSAVAGTPGPVIIRYEDPHRVALLRICHETGFLGQSLDGILSDSSLFTDLATHCFLAQEPQGIRLALLDGRVSGYLLCAPDAGRIMRCQRRYYVGRILRELPRMLHAAYADRRFYGNYLRSFLRGELVMPAQPDYPGVLHINVLPGSQGRGLGGSLLQAGIEWLAAGGCRAVHLQTSSGNLAMLRFIERRGWKLLAERPTDHYAAYGHPRIRLLQYGLRLERKHQGGPGLR